MKKTLLGKLPEPCDDERILSQRLVTQIKRLLMQDDALTFAQFMSAALYTPGLGYYANDLTKFGAEGDFITAPEISPLFSQCVAKQVAEINATLTQASVLELGAGSGALAESMLLTLQLLSCVPEHYYILEPSAVLQQRQQQRLQQRLPADLFARVRWLNTLPKQFVGVVVGNEVVDALPVEVIRLYPKDAQQAYVRWDEAKACFAWDWHAIVDARMQDQVDKVRHLIGSVGEQGYQTEWCSWLSPWMLSLAESMQQGAIILIDYGYHQRDYYAPERWMGSLRAHYRQRAHNNPFWYPGLQDLTAHVNFTELAYAGFHAGLQVAGYTTQAHFLLALGIASFVDPNADVLTNIRAAQQIKTLTMPDEMGETFKVMAFLKDMDMPLSGFALQDMRTSL